MIQSDPESKPGPQVQKDQDQQSNQELMELHPLLKSALEWGEDAQDQVVNESSGSNKSQTKSTNKRELKKEQKMNKTLKLKPDPISILQ